MAKRKMKEENPKKKDQEEANTDQDDFEQEPKDGKECRRVIHTHELGYKVHNQYARPVRLTMGDFLKVYSPIIGLLQNLII